MENYNPPFEINNQMVSKVSTIMMNIGRISSVQDFYKSPILRKQNRIKSIHSSCAIEANSLSLDQIEDTINGKKVIGPKKDIQEVKNAIKAYQLLEKINPLKENDLKYIHSVMGNEVIKGAGNYRTGNEGVKDENDNVIFIAPPTQMVSSLMHNLFDWTKRNFKTINLLILSCVFHYEFVFIHPFTDDNGRMARFWQNAILGKINSIFYYLPLESFIERNQERYYSSIAQSNANGNSNVFIEFMLDMINQAVIDFMNESEIYAFQNSIYVKRLLTSMKPKIWYSANEILSLLDLKSKETLRKNYLNPAIEKSLICLEFPEKPTSKNQRYKLK